MASLEVEERIKRIQSNPGVLGYIVINGDGLPVRSSLDNATTVNWANLLNRLAIKARSTVRDVDPTNDLTFLRIRTKKHEVLIAPDKDYLFVVIQNPGSS